MRKLAEAASWMVHYFGLPALIASAASAPPAARAPRQHERRAAEKGDELALRSITSSASASSVGGTSRPNAFVSPLIVSSKCVSLTDGLQAPPIF